MTILQNAKSGTAFEQDVRPGQPARVAKAFVDAILRVCEKLARSRVEALMKSGAHYWE